jgi:hypothetical protein
LTSPLVSNKMLPNGTKRKDHLVPTDATLYPGARSGCGHCRCGSRSGRRRRGAWLSSRSRGLGRAADGGRACPELFATAQPERTVPCNRRGRPARSEQPPAAVAGGRSPGEQARSPEERSAVLPSSRDRMVAGRTVRRTADGRAVNDDLLQHRRDSHAQGHLTHPRDRDNGNRLRAQPVTAPWRTRGRSTLRRVPAHFL